MATFNNGFYPQYFSSQNYTQPQPFQQPQPQQPQQPQYLQAYQQTPVNPQNPFNNFIWVKGLDGANNFLVRPNETVPLWDSDASVIYVKSVDANGVSSIRTIDYKFRNDQPNPNPQVVNNVDYATREDFNALRTEIDQMKTRLNSLSGKKSGKEYKNE